MCSHRKNTYKKKEKNHTITITFGNNTKACIWVPQWTYGFTDSSINPSAEPAYNFYPSITEALKENIRESLLGTEPQDSSSAKLPSQHLGLSPPLGRREARDWNRWCSLLETCEKYWFSSPADLNCYCLVAKSRWTLLPPYGPWPTRLLCKIQQYKLSISPVWMGFESLLWNYIINFNQRDNDYCGYDRQCPSLWEMHTEGLRFDQEAPRPITGIIWKLCWTTVSLFCLHVVYGCFCAMMS